MIGIAGTVYRVIAPDGWLAQAFNHGMLNGLVSLCAVGLLAGLLWMKRGNALIARRSKLVETVIVGFAVAGTVYLLQPILSNVLIF
jgi:hypothetical protein